jgi:hypothetical protein
MLPQRARVETFLYDSGIRGARVETFLYDSGIRGARVETFLYDSGNFFRCFDTNIAQMFVNLKHARHVLSASLHHEETAEGFREPMKQLKY